MPPLSLVYLSADWLVVSLLSPVAAMSDCILSSCLSISLHFDRHGLGLMSLLTQFYIVPPVPLLSLSCHETLSDKVNFRRFRGVQKVIPSLNWITGTTDV